MQAAGATAEQMEMNNLCDRSVWIPGIMIVTTRRYNEGPALEDIQERCAWAITMHPWPEARMVIETLIRDSRALICPGALAILAGAVVQNHTDPHAFLSQFADLPTEVMELIP